MFEYTVGLSQLLQGSMFEYTVGLSKLLQGSMFEYTVGLSKLLPGSTQDVLRAYEEVTQAKEIVIDIRQIADAEYSEIYKTTAEIVNIAGTVTVISTPRCCGR